MTNLKIGDSETHRTLNDIKLTVTVQERTHVADGVVALTLVSADPMVALPAWSAGAHIDVFTDGSIVRQYSLCGDPRNADSYRIGVLRDEGGRGGSKFIHDEVRVGSELTIRGPRNHFELTQSDRYAFIAGGIGITPILPMILQVKEQGAEWTLLYGGRTRSSMAFLRCLEEEGPHVVAWPQDESGVPDLHRVLGQLDRRVSIYACGPEPLLVAVEQTCQELGLAAPRVERFKPVDTPAHSVDSSFVVELQQSSKILTVGHDASILQTLESVGVMVPFSCRQGTCGTCETAVLGGEVDHRDSILTDDEKAANDTMMICVSRGRGKLTLDL
ncbi:PDR/VanB family oxidoreductase [Rhodococcus sp. 114MFTsu3.1]|uniref:PDR/VanB family oxidoreductase n=1 Tax=Rhodococcus sp. 114MFTsu3.1 TaxID=1172184 RepID=UPI0003A1A409|nr:PDR/VanB family oxidoreductase [Rhodococcus sp. 114MFTsu3.1]